MNEIASLLKKEILNIAASLLCAYTLSILINQTVFLLFLNKPHSSKSLTQGEKSETSVMRKISVDMILQKSFFEKGGEVTAEDGAAEVQSSAITDLELIGTITGNSTFARALIKSKNAKETEVFKHGDTVFGYKLKSIKETSVVLISGGAEKILEMYPPEKAAADNKTAAKGESAEGGDTITKTLSRAELTQDTQNNLDNMLRGIRAGPYRENNEVVGFELKSVSSANMLYKYGMRSGDVIRRINGHPIDSTAKLIELWQQFPKESRVLIDIQRNGRITTFDYTISD